MKRNETVVTGNAKERKWARGMVSSTGESGTEYPRMCLNTDRIRLYTA